MINKKLGLIGLVAVAIVVLIIAVFALGNREKGESRNSRDMRRDEKISLPEETKSSQEEPELLIYNLGLNSFNDVDVTTNALREYQSKGLKGFYVFGDSLSENRINPNFEYSSLKPDTQIISAIDGEVVFIKDQNEAGKSDFEIIIKPTENSMWTLAYDHIVNVQIQKGDKVKVGQILGNPSQQNNGLYRSEFQINKDIGSQTTHVCPTSLLAPEIKDEQIQGLTQMMEAWNGLSGLELYNIAAQNPAGCLVPVLTSQQAEGR